jgi:hypothetical protein
LISNDFFIQRWAKAIPPFIGSKAEPLLPLIHEHKRAMKEEHSVHVLKQTSRWRNKTSSYKRNAVVLHSRPLNTKKRSGEEGIRTENPGVKCPLVGCQQLYKKYSKLIIVKHLKKKHSEVWNELEPKISLQIENSELDYSSLKSLLNQ